MNPGLYPMEFDSTTDGKEVDIGFFQHAQN